MKTINSASFAGPVVPEVITPETVVPEVITPEESAPEKKTAPHEKEGYVSTCLQHQIMRWVIVVNRHTIADKKIHLEITIFHRNFCYFHVGSIFLTGCLHRRQLPRQSLLPLVHLYAVHPLPPWSSFPSPPPTSTSILIIRFPTYSSSVNLTMHF